MEEEEVNVIKQSPAAIELLDRLLDAAPPRELRDNLLEIYHTYLIHAHQSLPLDFEKIALNMYLLINCLGKLEETVAK
jgi:hypothetical protein